MRTPPLFLTPISPYVWSSSHFVNVDPHPRRPGPNSAMTHPANNYLADSIKRFLSVLTLSTFVTVRNWSLRIVVRCASLASWYSTILTPKFNWVPIYYLTRLFEMRRLRYLDASTLVYHRLMAGTTYGRSLRASSFLFQLLRCLICYG